MSLKRRFYRLAGAAALLLALLPFGLRRLMIRAFLFGESRLGRPEDALRRLFRIEDDLHLLINERATAMGGGVHVKHRLTGYHDFFVSRIAEGSKVLDIGCGIAALARSIATRVPGVEVVGIDNDPAILSAARRHPGNPPNLTLRGADAKDGLKQGGFDVVVLSNVLEHIEDRVGLLRQIAQSQPNSRLLVRVPMFERHWSIPLRNELGIGYLSDPTHFIEHRVCDFINETCAAGWKIEHMQTVWGEIWAELRA